MHWLARIFLVSLIVAAMGWADDLPPTLPIGASAPDFSLPGVDGKIHTLKDFDSSKVLVIVFTCDHCPTAQLYENRIKALAADYRDKGVDLVAIQPNDPNAVRLDEMGYTDLGDSLPEMKIRAQYRHFDFPYLYDGETQAVARKYGPVSTPHVFVFDQQRKLRYQGRVDNSPREPLVKIHDARDAIDAVLAGKPVAHPSTPTVGCSIKWAYKEAGGQSEMGRINATPITVDLVTPEHLTALRKNGTGKVLLVNFWATWCGPCTSEFPELQKMYRMYKKRAFDLVTVSINYPDEKKGVMRFLESQHATSRNLLFATMEPYAEMAAFNNQWKGAVPYTMLIGIDGRALYENQGGINALEVRRKILENLPDDDYIGQQAYWNGK